MKFEILPLESLRTLQEHSVMKPLPSRDISACILKHITVVKDFTLQNFEVLPNELVFSSKFIFDIWWLSNIMAESTRVIMASLQCC